MATGQKDERLVLTLQLKTCSDGCGGFPRSWRRNKPVQNRHQCVRPANSVDQLRYVAKCLSIHAAVVTTALFLIDKDVIWDAVGAFIEGQLRTRKAVIIPNFGTFGFSQIKYDVGTRVVLVRRPIFMAAERLLQTLGIQQRQR